MSFAASLNRLESINFQRFLRRNVIDRTVLLGRILLGCFALGFLIAFAYRVYTSKDETHSAIEDFNRRIDESGSSAGSEGSNLPKTQRQYGIIAQKAIFGALGQPTPNANQKPPPKPGANTQFSLIGTFLTAGQPAYAIIEEQKKKTQDVFLLNDSVFGEAKLTGIFADRVEIVRAGQTEVLTLDVGPDAGGGTSSDGGSSSLASDEFSVDEGELDRALENLPMLLTQARAVPFFKEGRAVGLRMFAIRAGSLFEKIGLQNGDVLKTANGFTIGTNQNFSANKTYSFDYWVIQ